MTRFEKAIDNAKCLFMLLGDKNAIYANMDWNYYPVEAPIVKKIELWATGPVVDEKTVVMLS